MSFWYLPPKDGKKHALIGTREWETCNFKIFFKEAIAKETDDFWFLLMDIEQIKPGEIKNIGDSNKDWKFEPQLCLLKFAKKDYERKGQPIKQSLPEKFFCKKFSELEPGKCYTGYIHIQSSPQMECLVDGTGKIGDTVFPPDILKSFSELYCKFVTVEPTSIDSSILEAVTSKQGFYGGRKGQGELDKLNDRLEFTLQQFKLAFPDAEITNLGHVYKLTTSENEDTQWMASTIWSLITNLIGTSNTLTQR